MSATWVLAQDVLVLAARRRVLGLYLILGLAVAVGSACTLELSAERVQAARAPGALPGEVQLAMQGGLVPGTLSVLAVGGARLRLDPAGALRDEAGAEVGRLEGDRLLLGAGFPAPGQELTVRWGVKVDSRASRRAAGAPERYRVAVLGADLFGHDSAGAGGLRAPADQALPRDVRVWLYALVLLPVGAVLGPILALLAVGSAVPHAFRRGQAELLLTRPVRRGQVVLARYAGGLLFGALQLLWLLLVLALVLWVRFEIVPWRGFLAACGPLLKFSLLLAISSAAGTLTRSGLLGLIAAALTWVASFGVSTTAEQLSARSAQLPALDGLAGLARALELVVPRITTQDQLTRVCCGMEDGAPWAAVAQALLWVVLLLGLTVAVARRRDC